MLMAYHPKADRLGAMAGSSGRPNRDMPKVRISSARLGRMGNVERWQWTDLPGVFQGARSVSKEWCGMGDSDVKVVIDLGVKFKKPFPEDLTLIVGYPKCYHGPFIVDSDNAEVTCGKCGEKLNPMVVLDRLARKESQYRATAERYQEEMKRLAERSRTKCQHCGKMTRISGA